VVCFSVAEFVQVWLRLSLNQCVVRASSWVGLALVATPLPNSTHARPVRANTPLAVTSSPAVSVPHLACNGFVH
jgi:hypothetical protein